MFKLALTRLQVFYTSSDIFTVRVLDPLRFSSQMTSQAETAASTALGSEALQSVALELVIFCATIAVALVLKVSSFRRACAVFFDCCPVARRVSLAKSKSCGDDDCQQSTIKEYPLPSAEDSASSPATQSASGRTSSRAHHLSHLQGPARTLETIMELTKNKNAAEALALYAEFRSSEADQVQDSLRLARRAGLDFYSALVQAAVRAGQPEMVLQLLDDMTGAHIERTLSFYESVMKVLAGKKHYREALLVYKRLSSEGFKASPVTLSCLINFAAELGELDSAIKFFEQLDATSKPSIRAYMVALRVYSKQQDWTKSLEIVRSMQARRVPVDSLILNTVLATGVTAGKTEAAEELLQETAMYKPQVPDVISYNTVLKGYAHSKIADKALKTLELMLARGVRPNGITFNTVMDAAVRGSQTDDAWKVLDLMKEAGIQGDKFTCTILMKALHENSTPRQLSKLIDMIQFALPQCDATMSGSIFRGILKVATRLNNTALVMQAFKQMRCYRVLPTSVDYQMMIQTLALQCQSADCSTIWRSALTSASTGSDGQQQQEQQATEVVATIFTSVMHELAQQDEVESMICAFESLLAATPACESEQTCAGSPKSFEVNVPPLLQQCRAALIQAASRKQHSSPAFKRLLELAPEQGLPLEALMQCQQEY